MIFLSNNLNIIKVQIKLELVKKVLICIVYLFLLTVLFSIKNLDSYYSTLIIERFLCIIGIILITPLCLPEENFGIYEIVGTKKTSYFKIITIRMFLSIFTMFIFILLFSLVLKLNNCDFIFFKTVIGSFITALFLGSLSFFVYCITKNIISGYIFSLSNNSFTEKYWLLGISIALALLGVRFKILKKYF